MRKHFVLDINNLAHYDFAFKNLDFPLFISAALINGDIKKE